MKKLLLAGCLSLLSLAAFAQDSEQSNGAGMNPQMQQMQARMQAMRAQMELIQATEDPEERARLMQEHMQSMHAGMMMMGEMMGGGMPDEQVQQCQEPNTECRMNRMQMQQRMMGQRMGMMQQMMQQMMEQMMQQSMQQQPPDGGAAENHEEHH